MIVEKGVCGGRMVVCNAGMSQLTEEKWKKQSEGDEIYYGTE